ncbi:hypothetical protein ABPG72_016148 [Tetrahymena utriculariae]
MFIKSKMADRIKAAKQITIPIQPIPAGPYPDLLGVNSEQKNISKVASCKTPLIVTKPQHMYMQSFTNIYFSKMIANIPKRIKQNKIIIGNPYDLAARQEINSLIILISKNSK